MIIWKVWLFVFQLSWVLNNLKTFLISFLTIKFLQFLRLLVENSSWFELSKSNQKKTEINTIFNESKKQFKYNFSREASNFLFTSYNFNFQQIHELPH